MGAPSPQHHHRHRHPLWLCPFLPFHCLLNCPFSGYANLIDLDRIIIAHGLDTSHHLLLRDQVVDPLQQAQKTLHAPAPFVQDLVRVSRFRERDDPRGPIDLGVDGLSRHQLTDVAFRLFLVQVEQLGESVHLYPSVVFRYDADVMLDDTLA